MLSAFDLSIVRADARLNLETQQALGNKVLARVNVFEVIDGHPHAQAARMVEVPLLPEAKKGYFRLDATHPNWVPLVVYEIIQDAAELGFDGFVISGLETLSQDAERAACVRLLEALENTYPDKTLVMEGGFDLVSSCHRALEGVLFLGQDGLPQSRRDKRIREVRRLGIQPLVVDFMPAETPQAVLQECALRYQAMGALSAFTTLDLQGVHLGPLVEMSRDIAVLHTGDARSSFTAQVLHGSLEWLGYRVRYVQVNPQMDVATLLEAALAKSCAVVFDRSLDVEALPNAQSLLLNLAQAARAKKKALLFNRPLWKTALEFKAWADLLDLKGSGTALEPTNLRVRLMEEAFLARRGQLNAGAGPFLDLQAPAGSSILFSTTNGQAIADTAFLTNWGGMWLDDGIASQPPLLNPLSFLEICFKGPEMPVPDLASQNGRRLFIPTVSSKGFAQTTSLPGLPTTGEALMERLLSRYSIPFTVALCESEVNATAPGLNRRDALRLQSAAKHLLALPHVHAASATMSRPQAWQSGGPMEREVAGSLAALHRQLLPEGKKIELVLWPESSPAPDERTVSFSRQMGVENASMTRHTAGPFPLPPMTWGHGNSHQTLATAAAPQDRLHAEEFISQSEAENQRCWTHPLHLQISFEDALNEARLWEAERTLDWCVSQPLHAMSLADYARLTRDAAQTHVFMQGPRHWIIVNEGHARTFRLPRSLGLPDLERSAGLAGYTVRGSGVYIHTLGRRRTEIVLSEEGSPRHLRLAASSGEVRYLEAGHYRALLEVADLRPVELDFEGLPPGAICQVFTSEQPQLVLADGNGRVSFTVPARTTVQFQVMPATESAMR